MTSLTLASVFNICLHSCSFQLPADFRKLDTSVNREPRGNWRCKSNSRDVVGSSPSFSRPAASAPRRACSQAISLTWKQLVFLFCFLKICSALFLRSLNLPLLVRERVTVFFRSLNPANCFCQLVCVHRKNYKMIVWRKTIRTQDLPM